MASFSTSSSPHAGHNIRPTDHSVAHIEQMSDRLAPSPSGRKTPATGFREQNGHKVETFSYQHPWHPRGVRRKAVETARRAALPGCRRTKPSANGMQATHATDRFPGSPTRAQTVQWAQARRPRFQKEIRGTSAISRQDRIPKIPANTNTVPFGTSRHAGRSAAPPPRTGERKPVHPHARSGGPTCIYGSLSRHLFPDLLEPEPVMRPGPSVRNFSTDNGSETAANHRGAHVDMDDEAADCRERKRDVYRDRKIAQPPQSPRNRFNKP